ncbi:hypothetical protein [Mycoplasma bradburyae]|uniref:Uncharacterized protein n=1 Tax=Mycoplasma bradburyae TaxID=2963128 RepID=A0ABT5GB97_9MOLU|nr:hypothetical protein [Mycoplasma bradburyae]MDC4181850.1 hypothetical protein [Mycoplasma bradburyae]UTS70149.1 hypothetical protein NMG68_00100 [Mycoplasma bradburyae]
MDRAKFLKISSFMGYAVIILFLFVVMPVYLSIIFNLIKVNNLFVHDFSSTLTTVSITKLRLTSFIDNYVATLVISLFFIIYNLIYLRKNKNTWLASLFPFCFKELKTSSTFAYKMKPGSYWTLYTFLILSILAIALYQLHWNVATSSNLIVVTMINIIFLVVICCPLISFIIIITTSDYKTAKLNKSNSIETKTNDRSMNVNNNK